MTGINAVLVFECSEGRLDNVCWGASYRFHFSVNSLELLNLTASSFLVAEQLVAGHDPASSGTGAEVDLLTFEPPYAGIADDSIQSRSVHVYLPKQGILKRTYALNCFFSSSKLLSISVVLQEGATNTFLASMAHCWSMVHASMFDC